MFSHGDLLCCREYELRGYPYGRYKIDIFPPRFDVVDEKLTDGKFSLTSGRIMGCDGFFGMEVVCSHRKTETPHGKLYFHLATDEEKIIYHNLKSKNK